MGNCCKTYIHKTRNKSFKMGITVALINTTLIVYFRENSQLQFGLPLPQRDVNEVDHKFIHR